MNRKVPREVWLKNLTESLQRKWASGTRKKNPPVTEHTRQLLRAANLGKDRSAQAAKNREKQLLFLQAHPEVKERIAKQMREFGEALIGVPKTIPGLRADENHLKAKVWHIRSPAGVDYHCKNLSLFIRNNSHLFEPEDVRWVGSRCKASHGISAMGQNRKPPGRVATQWKGWVLISVSERKEGSPDLLERRVQ